MGRFLREEIFSGRQNPFDFDSMTLGFAPAGWLSRLPDMLPAYPLEPVPVYKYAAESTKFDWRSALPDGFTVHKVDAALLDCPSVQIPEELTDFCDIDGMWFSRDDFLARGGGMAVVHEGRVVSWCVADLALDDVVEVGIITLPDYRRRGLAAIATAAMVEDCLRRGFTRVNWQCNQDNVGSWKTAEKVGFKRRQFYTYYYFMFDLLDHFAELGWYHYKRGDYARTAAFYEQVFRYRKENPIYYMTLAADACARIGDVTKAFDYLDRAVDAGLDNLDWLMHNAAFVGMRTSPAFDRLCERIRSTSAKP
jgi:RimJ/RimL family protein N-acetyltransferase